jgi:hypothetical protein
MGSWTRCSGETSSLLYGVTRRGRVVEETSGVLGVRTPGPIIERAMSPLLSRLLVRYIAAVQTARYIRYTQHTPLGGRGRVNQFSVQFSCSVVQLFSAVQLHFLVFRLKPRRPCQFISSQFIGRSVSHSQRFSDSAIAIHQFIRHLHHES